MSIVRPGLAGVLRCGVIEGSHTHSGRRASQHLRRAEQRRCISAEQWPRQKEKRRFLEGKQLFLSFLLQLSEAASPKRPSSIPGSAACAHVGRNYIGAPAVPEKLEPRLQACLASLPRGEGHLRGFPRSLDLTFWPITVPLFCLSAFHCSATKR